MQHRFAEPHQCAYWHNPELVRDAPMKEGFELVETYADESHLRRYLLKCRECGQLYFFEFYEWVDWEHGNDPQYSNTFRSRPGRTRRCSRRRARLSYSGLRLR